MGELYLPLRYSIITPIKTIILFLNSVALALVLFPGTALADFSPKKVLVFTKSSGFQHDAIKADSEPGHGYAFRVLRAYGLAHHIEFVESKDGSLFAPEYLAQFDAYIFYTTGDLTKAKG